MYFILLQPSSFNFSGQETVAITKPQNNSAAIFSRSKEAAARNNNEHYVI